MVVFWIMGGLFFAIGLIVSIPTPLKILKCKGHATGKILSIDSTDKNARAIYEYAVAGKKYTGQHRTKKKYDIIILWISR